MTLQLDQRNEILRIINNELREQAAKQMRLEKELNEAREENIAIQQKLGGQGFLTESLRVEMEMIKKRNVETAYLERAVEDLQRTVDQLKSQLSTDLVGVKNQMTNLSINQETKLKLVEEKATAKKEDPDAVKITGELKARLVDYDRRIGGLEVKFAEADLTVQNQDKKVSDFSKLLKEQDLRQFKNEIRISQLENRQQVNEQRLSNDGRRII